LLKQDVPGSSKHLHTVAYKTNANE